jgi:hypothetical protein
MIGEQFNAKTIHDASQNNVIQLPDSIINENSSTETAVVMLGSHPPKFVPPPSKKEVNGETPLNAIVS